MTLHLVKAPLDARAFAEWRGRRGHEDTGAALHALLSGLFGKGALQPFRLFAPRDPRRALDLYGYAAEDAAVLRALAAEVGTPDAERALPPEALMSKPMPQPFESGRRLGFDLRLRPVRRVKEPLPDPQQRDPRRRTIPAGAEIDAFRLEALRRFPEGFREEAETSMIAADRSREAVYADWLAERLSDAATLETVRLAAFERTRVCRDGTHREGPDAVLQGTLTVASAEAFADRLARGVGRHRAYGYGMLLLRPPDSRPGRRAGPPPD